jgi:hypothetical protein
MKKPEGKHEPHLIYQSMTIAVARQRKYGIEKHGSIDGWKTTSTIEHLDAARRHIDEAIEAVMTGDMHRLIDPDSGQWHYAAAICNLMFEIERLYCDAIEQPSLPKRDINTGGYSGGRE